MFFHKRPLGVREANAIDSILIYEWKHERGLFISEPERRAYAEAWQVVEREPSMEAEAAQKMRAAVVTKEELSHEDYDEVEYEDAEVISSTQPMSNAPMKVMIYIIAGFVVWITFASIYNLLTAV